MYAILVKIWKGLKVLNSISFIRKTWGNHVYNWVWLFGLTFTVLQWIKINFKIVNFKISAKVQVCNFGEQLKMTKTAQFCSNHQENTCKYSLHWNLIILTDLHCFIVNEDKVLVNIWKRQKLLNSVPFIKKTRGNCVYIRVLFILTDFHSFTGNEGKLEN